jgi:hypothetical protein
MHWRGDEYRVQIGGPEHVVEVVVEFVDAERLAGALQARPIDIAQRVHAQRGDVIQDGDHLAAAAKPAAKADNANGDAVKRAHGISSMTGNELAGTVAESDKADHTGSIRHYGPVRAGDFREEPHRMRTSISPHACHNRSSWNNCWAPHGQEEHRRGSQTFQRVANEANESWRGVEMGCRTAAGACANAQPRRPPHRARLRDTATCGAIAPPDNETTLGDRFAAIGPRACGSGMGAFARADQSSASRNRWSGPNSWSEERLATAWRQRRCPCGVTIRASVRSACDRGERAFR